MSVEQQASAATAPLAIIGIGCLFPKAGNARAYWLNIKNGIDGIGPVPTSHWNPDDYLHSDPKAPDRTYAARGGFLDPVDFRPLEFGIAPNDLEATDTSQLLGLVAARQALNDAGYGPERSVDRNRISVILGVTGTLELVIPLGARLGHPRWKKALANANIPDDTAKQIIDEIGNSYVGWQENSFPGLLGNVVAGRIANRLDLGGTNCVVDAACASSLSAIHLAGLELAAGRCDIAVTGGVDTFNDIFMFMCFSKTPALSATGDSKPFDASGDGTILGEGIGIVVLKRLADAQRDGDRVYAVIRGLGSSSDGKGNAIYAPVAAGQVKALRNAYHLAGIGPETVELVEGHGTGTRVGDGVEAAALTEVYRQARPDGTWCALGSVKSQIGHTKAAAGAAGLIKAALALHHRVLPPTIKVKEPIEALQTGRSPFYVNTEKRPWIGNADHPRRAAVSAFGFGGSNFHCVLEEHNQAPAAIDWDGEVEIVALSARSVNSLSGQIKDWKQKRTWTETQRDAAQSRVRFAISDPHRLLWTVMRETDLAHLAESSLAKLETDAQARFWRLPEGAYYGAGPAAGKLAVLFPGQGSQYVGMLRDLACAFPDFQDVLADANRAFDRQVGASELGRLSDLIYPFAVFSKSGRQEQEAQLRQTEVAQPAIGAVSLAALQVLEGFDVQPEVYAGHSYGELPALCAAGCFDEEALHRISRLRGHLMASFHGGDAGAMLAVHAPIHSIETLIRDETLDLIIANRNAPAQSVLSGRRQEIDRAIECLDRRSVRHTKLAVAAAFHSPLVAGASKPFRDALNRVEIKAASKTIFANTSGQPYPDEPEAIREMLARQLASPVDFVREIGVMVQGGARTFVEVGPGATLTKLVASILGEHGEVGRECDAFALDASSGKRNGLLDLSHTLARLAARGHSVDLVRWQEGIADQIETPPTKPTLTVPICGANYVAPKTGPLRPLKDQVISPTGQTVPVPVTTTPLAEKPITPPKPTPRSMPHPTPPTTASSSPARPAVHAEALTQALQVTQQSLAAFQQLQEQTAQVHRQFLLNQESAQRTLQMLVEQQQSLLAGGSGVAVPPAAAALAPRPRAAELAAPPAKLPTAAPVGNGDHSHTNGSAAHARKSSTISAPVQVPAKVLARTSEPSADVKSILLGIISEKTGYPAEMLSADMSLDADLGIDSIKRVEIFSAVQEKLPQAPVVKPEHLGTLQTLNDVIAFLAGPTSPKKAAGEKPQNLAAAEEPPQARIAENCDDVAAILFAVVSEKTGYPTEMLNADMALDADLGIDSIKRVEIFSALQERMPAAPVVKPEHLGTLHSLNDVVKFLANSNGASESEPATAKKKSVAADDAESKAVVRRSVLKAIPYSNYGSPLKLAPGSAVVVVGDASTVFADLQVQIKQTGLTPRPFSWSDDPAAADLSNVSALLLLAPSSTPPDFAVTAFRWLRTLAPALRHAVQSGGAVFATVTALDGAFGLQELAVDRPVVTHALAGLAKTAALEWPDVVCKAIDLTPDLDRSRLRDVWNAIMSRGATEVGFSNKESITLQLVDEIGPAVANSFSANDVILVTGGARGVTAAVAIEIAKRFQPTFVLLGRTAIDAMEPEWLSRCDDEQAVKQALVKNRTAGTTPKALDAEARAVLTRREASAAIAQMRSLGARVFYQAVNVADAQQLKKAVEQARSFAGPITHLIHGAGVLADRRIEDLTDEQFRSVYATKVGGLESLLAELATDPLRGIVLFSSSTARFGRVGQAAYAAANEALNKLAQRERRRRPGCKTVAINWGPWAGGMVTAALKQLFASEGVGVIPLKTGAEILIAEMAADPAACEITVLAQPPANAESAPAVVLGAETRPALHLAFEQQITLDDYPVLRSHVIDGRAVLPLALHLEMLAHAALHGNPGQTFVGMNDLCVLNGVQLVEKSTAVRVLAGKASKCENGLLVPVEMVGKRGGRDVVFSRGVALLAGRAPTAIPTMDTVSALKPYNHSIEEIYRRILFHGVELAALERVIGVSPAAISAICRHAPAPAAWLRQPLRSSWIADPLVLDAAFQLMIVWSQANRGMGCLPCRAGSYRQYRRRFPAGPMRIDVQIRDAGSSVVRADVGLLDEAGEAVGVLNDLECVCDEGLSRAFRNNRLPERVAAGGVSR